MTGDQPFEQVKDPRMTALANDLSEAIGKAPQADLDCDLACNILVVVAADYARYFYGEDFALGLCERIRHRLTEPMPEFQFGEG